MAIGFKHGSSGVDLLNFDVISFDSEEGTVQPSNPKENTIWVDSSYDVHAWDVSPTEPPRVSKTKNLIVYPYYETTHTEDGITFTDNETGEITVNGTATYAAYFRMSYNGIDKGAFMLKPGTYRLSGCPSGGSKSTHYLAIGYSYDNFGNTKWAYDTGSGVTFTVEKEAIARVAIEVLSGANLSNVVYKPQLERGSATTSFVKGDATGQVWVKTDSESAVTMNMLKKNSIVVQLGGAYVYSNDGWAECDAQVYQNGSWIPFSHDVSDPSDPSDPSNPDGKVYYYNAGDECTTITGGWTRSGWISSTYNALQTDAYVKINSDHVYFIGTLNHMSPYGTKNKVNLSSIKTLKASVEVVKGGYIELWICDNDNKMYESKNASYANGAVGLQTFSIDVENYNDSYYIVMTVRGATMYGNYPEAKLISVWGE